MSVAAPDRDESKAQFLANASKLEDIVLRLYRKKCYEDLRPTILLEAYHIASELTGYAVRANDIYTPNGTDRVTVERITIPKQQERVELFVKAKGCCADLSRKMTELYVIRPVKHRYRGTKKEIFRLLNEEYRLLKGMCVSEERKLKKLTE